MNETDALVQPMTQVLDEMVYATQMLTIATVLMGLLAIVICILSTSLVRRTIMHYGPFVVVYMVGLMVYDLWIMERPFWPSLALSLMAGFVVIILSRVFEFLRCVVIRQARRMYQ